MNHGFKSTFKKQYNIANLGGYDTKLISKSDSNSTTLISEVCRAGKKSLSKKEMLLNIQSLKRRAFRLRRLIDSSDDGEERKKAIKEYVHLIGQITGNN